MTHDPNKLMCTCTQHITCVCSSASVSNVNISHLPAHFCLQGHMTTAKLSVPYKTLDLDPFTVTFQNKQGFKY